MAEQKLDRCVACGKPQLRHALIRAHAIPPALQEHFARKHPAWHGKGFVCRACRDTERTDYLVTRLAEERGELSAVEAEVARKAMAHVAIAENIDREFRRRTTRGQRVADGVARLGGSWGFILTFGAF